MKISDLKAGDTIVTDGGFTCVGAGERKIEADERGELFFRCRSGQHFLAGQIGDDDELIVISKS